MRANLYNSKHLKTLGLCIFSALFFAFFFTYNTHSAKADAYLASDVLGQTTATGTPIFTQGSANNASSTVNSTGQSSPAHSAVDAVHHRLFVLDRGNHRILVYNLDSSNNLINHFADNVLGQPDFSSTGTHTTQNGLSNPAGLAYDPTNDRLFVADQSNSRVLIFNTSAISNGMNASNVLGQTNFTSSSFAASITGMYLPCGVTYDQNNQRLFVADTANNRVLVFDASSLLATNTPASNVLGQTLFTTANATTTINGMSSPYDVSYDSLNNRLFVADLANNRVLIFNTSSISDGMNASNVLGQASFISSLAVTSQNGLYGPTGVAYDQSNQRLFITDGNNHRALVFNLSNISNGMAAAAVFGQTDFFSYATSTTQSGFYSPVKTSYDSSNNRLYISDTNNNRTLIYNLIKLGGSWQPASPAIKGLAITTTTATSSQSQGTVSFGISGMSDLSANSSSGVVSGTPNTNGTYTLTMTATDTLGSIGNIVDTATSTLVVQTIYLASNVLGQSSFTASTSAVTQGGMADAAGVAYDATNNRLFVADSIADRVLVFDTTSLSNGMNASYVLGQSSFTASSSATTQSGMSAPDGLTFDSVNNRLFVADNGNNRILVFDTTTISNGENAAYVLGQANFTSSAASTSQSGLNGPTGSAFDPATNLLFVTDLINNRVLVFDTTSLSNGMNASYVLGQSSFTASSSATTQSGMRNPNASPTFNSATNYLFVPDTGNRRVLVFDTTALLATGTPASYVLGQTNFTSSSSAITINQFVSPKGTAADSINNCLFVADSISNRVVVFNTSSFTNGEDAVAILGQADFTSAIGGATNQSYIETPYSLAFDSTNNRLFVTDSGNKRVLIYKFIKLNTSSIPTTGTEGTSYSGTLSTANSQGNVTYTYSGNGYLTLSGTTLSGTPLSGQSYTLNFTASDTVSTTPVSVFSDASSVGLIVSAVNNSGGGSGGGGSSNNNTTAATPTSTPSQNLTMPPPGTGQQVYYLNQKLINDKGTYYLIIDNVRHGITNPGLLTSYGFTFAMGKTATADDLALPNGDLLLPGNGILAKTPTDKTVWLISNGQKHGFTSAAVFTALGFSFKQVLVITAPELNKLAVGSNISNAGLAHLPGVNIVDQGTIYWIDGGSVRHPYPSLDVFNSWNVPNDFSRVLPANNADRSLPIGSTVLLRVLE